VCIYIKLANVEDIMTWGDELSLTPRTCVVTSFAMRSGWCGYTALVTLSISPNRPG